MFGILAMMDGGRYRHSAVVTVRLGLVNRILARKVPAIGSCLSRTSALYLGYYTQMHGSLNFSPLQLLQLLRSLVTLLLLF